MLSWPKDGKERPDVCNGKDQKPENLTFRFELKIGQQTDLEKNHFQHCLLISSVQSIRNDLVISDRMHFRNFRLKQKTHGLFYQSPAGFIPFTNQLSSLTYLRVFSIFFKSDPGRKFTFAEWIIDALNLSLVSAPDDFTEI